MSDDTKPITGEIACSGTHPSPACSDPDCHIAQLDEIYAEHALRCGTVIRSHSLGFVTVMVCCVLETGHSGACAEALAIEAP